jgi:hypothetical protein
MTHVRRAAGRRLRAISVSIGLLLAGGCAEVTWWDAHGSWSGTVTLPGEAATQRTSGLTDPEAGSTDDRVRLCELSTMVLGMTFGPIERDRLAAIEVRTARPLCNEGHTQITGGTVLIWANPGSDPNVVSATRSDAWTVTGEIEITSYQSEALPDLDAGDTANTERIDGILSLTATDDAGSVIRIDGATFHLTVVASRVKLSISSRGDRHQDIRGLRVWCLAAASDPGGSVTPVLCPSCGEHTRGHYCAACGEELQTAAVPSLASFVRDSVSDVTSVDSRLISSLRALISRPGKLATP